VLANQLQGMVGAIVQSFSPGCKEENRNLGLWEWSDARPHSIFHD
jgi:hypothetical protein